MPNYNTKNSIKHTSERQWKSTKPFSVIFWHFEILVEFWKGHLSALSFLATGLRAAVWPWVHINMFTFLWLMLPDRFVVYHEWIWNLRLWPHSLTNICAHLTIHQWLYSTTWSQQLTSHIGWIGLNTQNTEMHCIPKQKHRLYRFPWHDDTPSSRISKSVWGSRAHKMTLEMKSQCIMYETLCLEKQCHNHSNDIQKQTQNALVPKLNLPAQIYHRKKLFLKNESKLIGIM